MTNNKNNKDKNKDDERYRTYIDKKEFCRICKEENIDCDCNSCSLCYDFEDDSLSFRYNFKDDFDTII